MKKTLVTLLTAALVAATISPVKVNAYTPENSNEELLYSLTDTVIYEFEDTDIDSIPDIELEELYETVWEIADEYSDTIEATLEKDYDITWFEYTVNDPDVYEAVNEFGETVVIAEYTIEYEVWGTVLEEIEAPVEPTYEEAEEVETIEVIEEAVEEIATVNVTEEAETAETVIIYSFPVYFTNELVTK